MSEPLSSGTRRLGQPPPVFTRKAANTGVVARMAATPALLLLASSLLYFFPYLVGSYEFYSPLGVRYVAYYHYETGYAVGAVVLLLCAAVLAVRYRDITWDVTDADKLEARVICVLLVGLGAYVWATPELMSAAKSVVLEGTNRGHLAFYNLCSLAIVFAALVGVRHYVPVVPLAIIGLLTTMFIGHRSSVAVAAVGVIYVKFRNTSILRMRKRYVLAVMAVMACLVLYKAVYVAVKLGDMGVVAEKLSPDNLTASASVGLEPFLTFAHLDLVFTSDYRLGCSNLWMTPVTTVPFIGELLDLDPCGYNAQVQPAFFSGYRGGVAANIWAEGYANFGYFGFPLMLLAILGTSSLLEWGIRAASSPALKSSLVLAVIQMTFYIQRNEFLGGWNAAKRVIIVGLIVHVVAVVWRRILTPRGRTAR